MSIGSRIKQRREELGYTQPKLAELVGVSKGTIGNYESNVSSPNEDILFKLFDILKCDANFLYQDNIDWEVFDETSPSEKEHIKKYRKLDTYGKEAVDGVLEVEYKRCTEGALQDKFKRTITINRFSIHKVSAGAGYDLNDGDQWKTLTVIDTPEARAADFAVEIDGDSMEPTYYSGDIVYVVKTTEIPVGTIGIFIQDGHGYIKEAGKNRLISHNKKFPDISGEVKIIGKVIGTAELPD